MCNLLSAKIGVHVLFLSNVHLPQNGNVIERVEKHMVNASYLGGRGEDRVNLSRRFGVRVPS